MCPPLPSAPGPDRLLQALDVMARSAQCLRVVIVVGTALSQGLDVVALGGQHHEALLPALHTQGIAAEQLCTHRLQSSTRDALRCRRLLEPALTLVLAASAGAIAYQHTAARLTAWFRCCLWHGSDKTKPGQRVNLPGSMCVARTFGKSCLKCTGKVHDVKL